MDRHGIKPYVAGSIISIKAKQQIDVQTKGFF